jgi:hypothetical protein
MLDTVHFLGIFDTTFRKKISDNGWDRTRHLLNTKLVQNNNISVLITSHMKTGVNDDMEEIVDYLKVLS